MDHWLGLCDIIGVKNIISTPGSISVYGINNTINGTSTGAQYGVNNTFSGTGTGNLFGNYTTISNSANGEHYGSYIEIAGSGNGQHFGNYNYITGSGLNTPTVGVYNDIDNSSDGNYDYQIQIKSKDEIGEFAKSFNQMTYNIKMANKAKDEFLANLSHELKTPLTTIFGYSEMLMMGNNEVEEVIEYSKEIHAGSQKLNDYVNDLILLTDIETNISPNIGLIDINQVIDVEIEKQKNLIEEKEIILEYTKDYSLTLEGDIELLSKAISAILKNAIIYNKQKGKVIVCVVVNNENLPQNLEIKISDTGIGIAEEFQEKVFDKFFRIDSSLLYELIWNTHKEEAENNAVRFFTTNL